MTGVVVQFKLDGLAEAQKGVGQFSEAIKQTGKAANEANFGGLQSFSRSLTDIGSTLTRVGGTLTKYVTLPLIAAGGAALKFAVDAREAQQRFGIIMGDMGAEATKFSQDYRKALGLNVQQTNEHIASVFQLATNMGVGREASLKMAEGVAVLSNDMASFFEGVSQEEAFEKLRAGLAGNTRGLLEFGLKIDDATVKERLMRAGLVKEGDVLTEAQQALGRYMLLVEQTSKIQGDFARNIDSPSNQFRLLTARVKENAIALGNILLPIGKELANTVLKPLAGLLQNLINRFLSLNPETQRAIVLFGGLAIAIGPLLSAFGVLLKISGALLGANALKGLIVYLTGGAGLRFIAAFGTLATTVAAAASAFLLAAYAVRLYQNAQAAHSFTEAWQKTNDDFGALAVQIKDKVTDIVTASTDAVGKMFTLEDGTKPGDAMTADMKKMNEDLAVLFADSAADAQASFGKITGASEKAALAQLKFDEALRKSAERLMGVREQFARDSMELSDTIVDHRIRDIEREQRYDLNAQREMLLAERARFQALGEEGAQAVQRIDRELRELEIQMRDRTFGQGVRDAIGEFTDRATNLGQVARDIVGGAFQSLQDTISQVLQTGKLKFGDFLDFIKRAIADFIASQIVARFVGLLAAMVPGLAVGGTEPGVTVGTGTGTGTSVSVGGIPLPGGGVIGDILNTPIGIGDWNFGTLGEALGAAGAGFAGRQFAGFLGAHGLDADIGSAVGGGIGYWFGGPLGAGVGSFIGGVLGDLVGGLFGSDKDYPYGRADVTSRGGVASVTATRLLDDMDPEVIAGLGGAVVQGLNELLRQFGWSSLPGTSIGYDAGRPGSKLGEGFFAGVPGSFGGGAQFHGLADPREAVGHAIEVSLGRSAVARAALAEQGVIIPAYATGGDPIFTRPTLIQVGEGPERVSVRKLSGNAPGAGGVTLNVQGPAIFDHLSASRFARTLQSELQRRTVRGLA